MIDRIEMAKRAYSTKRHIAQSFVGAVLCFMAVAPAAAQTAQITPLPIAGSTFGVTVLGGNLWMSIDANAGRTAPACGAYCYEESIVRISTTAGTELLPMPALHFVSPLMVGGDNRIWGAVQYNAPVGVLPGPSVHLQTNAVIQCGLVSVRTNDDNYSFYPINAEVCGQNRSDLAPLRDGNLWLVGAESQSLANLHLAKISTNGFYTRIPISLPALPSSYPSVADDSKNNVWFASSTGKIARYVTTARTNGPAVGTVTEFSIATGRVIKALKRGPDGNVWFIESSASSATADSIGFVTPDGAVTEYQVSATGAVLSQMILGRDGTIWYLNSIDAEANTGPVRIGRITGDGAITETPIPEYSTVVRGLGFQAGARAISQWALASDRAWFALRPATTVATWDYAHAALSFSTANFFPVRTGSVYSTSQSTSQSFLRFLNTGTLAGSVTVTVRSVGGQTLGTWTSPVIGPNTELQYNISTIEAAIGINSANNPQYTMTLDTPITGNFQHVLYRPADGTLTNLSTCSSGVNAEAQVLSGVHSSLLGTGFPSSIAVKNTGTADQAATFGIYDARDGRKLTTYVLDNTQSRLFTEPLVGPTTANGVTVVTMAYIEKEAKLTPPAGAYHYVLKLEGGFTGFLQHLVNNTKLGVITDMTTACNFNGSTGTAATPMRVGAIFVPSASSQSYLRFYNSSATAGTVSVTVANQMTGVNVGTWTSPSIAPGSEQQFGIGVIADSFSGSTSNPYFTGSVTSTFAGYFQNVLFRPTDGTLTNLSTCGSGITATSASLSGVHTSRISGFPSSVVINNTASTAAAVTLGIYDARTGTKLGTYVTPAVPGNGQSTVAVSAIEAGLGQAPADGMFHYTIKAEGGFNGFLQHLVDNQQAAVITDMTTACALTPP